MYDDIINLQDMQVTQIEDQVQSKYRRYVRKRCEKDFRAANVEKKLSACIACHVVCTLLARII